MTSIRGSKVVVGVFSFMDDAMNAIKDAKKHDLDYRVYSPVPNHDLEHLTYPEKSPVRLVTATGAITGLIGGFALAILCSMDYPLRVSAKDIISPPGFVVIGYECTILFGALATLAALFHFCKIPDIFRKIGYDPRFSQDKFGVVVGCESAQADAVSERLRQCGAEEVEIRVGL